jgi:predicted DNA-binding transcriptional regulator AlpA
MSEQFPAAELLTVPTALSIAGILERAATEIRNSLGSSGKALDDLDEPLAHVQQHEKLLTPTDLAALLQIDERSLRRMRNAGEVPEPIEIGKLPRWRRAAIARWLEKK